jgi:hypothetical protein
MCCVCSKRHSNLFKKNLLHAQIGDVIMLLATQDTMGEYMILSTDARMLDAGTRGQCLNVSKSY